MTALVAGAIIALVAANIYLYVQIDHLRGDLAKTNEALNTGLSNLKDQSSVTIAAQQRHIEQRKRMPNSSRAKSPPPSRRCRHNSAARSAM